MNNITFTSNFFNWNPFSGVKWIGFIRKNEITLNDSEIVISSDSGKTIYPVKELEFCILENSYLGLANTKIYVGMVTDDTPKDECDSIWKLSSCKCFYLKKSLAKEFEETLKALSPMCYASNSTVVYSNAPWYRLDILLSGNKNSLWMNPKHIHASNDIKKGVEVCHYLDINMVKYFYTQGWLTKDLFLGAESGLKFENVTTQNLEDAKEYLLNHGANFAADADEVYYDSWSPKVLFSPSLWFTHSNIGFTEAGLVYHQKTFKTDDNIFLPWEKINLVTKNTNWIWPFSKTISIYGEQNILPRRNFPNDTANAISNVLKEKGLLTIESKTFEPSRHSSWIGILFSILTIGFYHLIVLIFTKKTTLKIGSGKMIWNGDLNYYTTDDAEGWINHEPQKEKRMNALVCDVKDVWDVWFVKKRWYHLWGYEVVRVNPYNIRTFDEAKSNQHSVYYTFVVKKLWSGDSSAIKNKFIKEGYQYDAIDKQHHKSFKKWAKWYVKKYC